MIPPSKNETRYVIGELSGVSSVCVQIFKYLCLVFSLSGIQKIHSDFESRRYSEIRYLR
jgi:hypothetical protein